MYSASYKRYVTALLLIAYIFNQTGAVFGFLMEPIKRDLGLSDSELGFLAGPALALFYALLGIPVARWADRSNRVNIMSAAIALWSAIVVLSATVGKFWQFALARVGVGVGEAGFSAVAQALIADYHVASERTRALSTFMLGIPFGYVASFLVGGWANQVYGWRAAFIIAGIPGLLVAALIKSTVREPRASTAAFPPSANAGQSPARPTLLSVFGLIWKIRTLRHLVLAQGIANIVVASVLSWIPSFFIRIHEVPSGILGTWLACIVGGGGGLGIWLGGRLTSSASSGRAVAKIWIVAVANILVPPLLVVVLWGPSPELALVMLAPAFALMFFFFGPTFAVVQTLCTPDIRATVASVFILIQILLGSIFGIQMLGVISDVIAVIVNDSAQALRWSMTLICLFGLWAAVHFWRAGQHFLEARVASMSEIRDAR